jgi:hypothetical protein
VEVEAGDRDTVLTLVLALSLSLSPTLPLTHFTQEIVYKQGQGNRERQEEIPSSATDNKSRQQHTYKLRISYPGSPYKYNSLYGPTTALLLGCRVTSRSSDRSCPLKY